MIGQERGLTLAIEDINAAGGVLGGPVTAVRASVAVDRPVEAAVDRLAADGANAILGPAGRRRCEAGPGRRATPGGLLGLRHGDVHHRGQFRRGLPAHRHPTTTPRRWWPIGSWASPRGRRTPGAVMILGPTTTTAPSSSGRLSAQLTAAVPASTRSCTPPVRVEFPEEAAAVTAAAPDVVVLLCTGEGVDLLGEIVGDGFPVESRRRARRPGSSPTSPSSRSRRHGAGRRAPVIGSTGDRVDQRAARDMPAVSDQLSYGAQMYDSAITIALAAVAAGSNEPVEVGPTSWPSRRRATCSTFAHCVRCWTPARTSTTRRERLLEIDANGDVSTARITTASVVDGQLVETATDEIDLVALRQEEIFAASVMTTQLQQVLKVLGYYEGDITGVFDEATADAVHALQRDLGLPETGEYDEATDAALRARLGSGAAALSASVAQLQRN